VLHCFWLAGCRGGEHTCQYEGNTLGREFALLQGPAQYKLNKSGITQQATMLPGLQAFTPLLAAALGNNSGSVSIRQALGV
jgi:hypothetical protein